MNKLEQAARQALEALEAHQEYGSPTLLTGVKAVEAITALREALAEQAEQKPVAWRVRGYNQFKTGNPAQWRYVDGTDKPTVNKPDCCDFELLYAAPVRTKDLTDDEIEWIVVDTLETWNSKDTMKDFARAVIAADREKNNANNNS